MAKVRLDKKGRKLLTGEYQNPDGRYVYHYTDKNGKKCKVYSWCLKSTDKPPKGRKCDKCLRVLKDEIAEDKTKGIDTQTAKKRTVDEQFEIFIDNKKTKIKKNTLTNYKYMYKKFIQPYFGKRKINTILYSEVNKYYQDLLTKQHFKVSTLENIHTILYPLFKLAIKDDIITKNPCEDLIAEYKTDKRQIGKSTIRHSFTKQQQDSFLGFVKDNIDKYERWYNLLVFFIGTACRISEVCALTWDDVDLAIRVAQNNPEAIKIIDAGSLKETTVLLAKYCDYIVCSNDFARDYTGIDFDYSDMNKICEVYDKISKDFNGKLIITLEANGSLIKMDDGFKLVKSIKVESVDSTGAGDIYHGAFTHFIANGYNVIDAMKYSNIAGALSVRKIGSKNSMPNYEDVINYHEL